MRRVQVEFIDVESGETVELASLPVERVPDPLELKSQVRLGANHYVVIRAEPSATHEVTQGGRLRLTVRKVADLTTADLVFQAPTLAPGLPALGPPDLPAALEAGDQPAVCVDRDDWRQLELVSRGHAERLAHELLAVRRILALRREDGFPELHVRDELLPAPAPPIGLEWLADQLRNVSVHPLRLAGLRTVASGFGLRGASGLLLYGTAPRGRIEVLAIGAPQGGLDRETIYHDVSALSEVGGVHGLVLIDWREAKVFPPERFAEALP